MNLRGGPEQFLRLVVLTALDLCLGGSDGIVVVLPHGHFFFPDRDLPLPFGLFSLSRLRLLRFDRFRFLVEGPDRQSRHHGDQGQRDTAENSQPLLSAGGLALLEVVESRSHQASD